MVELAIPVGSVASVWQSPLQVYIGVTLRRVHYAIHIKLI